MHDILRQVSSCNYPHPFAPTSRIGDPYRHASRSRHNSGSSSIAASVGLPRGRNPSRPSSSLSVTARLGLQSPTAYQANAATTAAAAVAMHRQIAAHASAVMAQCSLSPTMGPQHTACSMHLHKGVPQTCTTMFLVSVLSLVRPPQRSSAKVCFWYSIDGHDPLSTVPLPARAVSPGATPSLVTTSCHTRFCRSTYMSSCEHCFQRTPRWTGWAHVDR